MQFETRGSLITAFGRLGRSKVLPSYINGYELLMSISYGYKFDY